ncbi:MAG: hypothetical protein LW721_12305 [Flammeovirgaceae bacterium]|jgi:hypothetical protein|nr:hypothetical protein [Flammeovirgaceae bacterium]
MTTNTARILNAVIGISGLIHISGIIPNFEYNFQVGLAMIVLAVFSFLFNLFATEKKFSTRNLLVVKRNEIKWLRIKEVVGVATLCYLALHNPDGGNSVLVTFIIYFSLMVILDHRKEIEISDRYLTDNGHLIEFEKVYSIEIEQSHVFLSLDDESNEARVIDLTNLEPADRLLILEKFAAWKARLLD